MKHKINKPIKKYYYTKRKFIMSRKINIEFEWWQNNKQEITGLVQEQLEHYAMYHIFSQIKEAFKEGELTINYHSVEYRGYWKCSTNYINQ